MLPAGSWLAGTDPRIRPSVSTIPSETHSTARSWMALDALRRDIHRGRVARRDEVDHLVQAEVALRALPVHETLGAAVRLADPLARLVGVVEAEVVVDRFGGEHGGDLMAQGLHAVER